MTETLIATLQSEYDDATARCTEAAEMLRGLGFEPSGPLMAGQAAISLTEAQVAALAELRAADADVVIAREALFAVLRDRAGDARR